MKKEYRLRHYNLQGVYAPHHFYIGNCPLTGQGIGTQIQHMSAEQLEAWYKMDAKAAGKYVEVVEVPDRVETATIKKRKPEKKKMNGSKDKAGTKRQDDEEAPPPEDIPGAGERDNHGQ